MLFRINTDYRNAIKNSSGYADVSVDVLSEETGDWRHAISWYYRSQKTADVLVVEDNSDMRELLRRELEDLQCVVREAENGIQAISEYNQKQPDLIILDLMMPKMDGFEFVEYLRDIYQEWAPIVVMTAKDITMEDREHLNGAMKKILSKDNFSNQKLEDIVGEILVNWQQFQQ